MSAPRSISEAGAPARAGALPNLLIIGFQKCGTSALHYYLDLHPEVQMSRPKELNFLRGPPAPDQLEPAADRAIVAGLARKDQPVEWYRARFDGGSGVRGEASPAYTAPWFPEAAGRAAALLPDARLIALVRDPVELVRSSWQHMVSIGLERRGIADALLPGGMYVERARFSRCLGPWLERFDRDRILVIGSADLLERRRPTMRRAFEFLGIDPGFWDAKMDRERHVTAHKGWRRRLLDRIQRSRVVQPAFRLPQEVKWWVERATSVRGEAAHPVLDTRLRSLLRSELADEPGWLRREFGIDVEGWLR